MSPSKGASLVDGVQGGMLDDVDVTIISSTTGEYSYPNSNTTTNALILVLKTDDGTEHTEAFSSGQVLPTDDGSGFDRKLDVKSKAKQFIDSMLALKFPGIDTSVRVFEGAKIHVNRKALPKMGGIDKEGDRDKTVLLATKIVTLPGKKAAPAARPTAAATPVKTAPPAASSTANGEPTELDARAIEVIQQIVATAPENTITRLKLGTAVMLTLAKAKDPQMAVIKKLATDPTWLQAFAELGGWSTDGESLVLG